MIFKGTEQLITKISKGEIRDLLTDSRNILTPGATLFFAIRTKGGNDGHLFIEELYKKGVRDFVGEYEPEGFPSDANLYLVEDVVETLQAIGSLHKTDAKCRIAITGSYGKTTLKEILFHLMDPDKKVARSPRSYNSQTGVPLSLWEIRPDTDVAIIEVGISKKGEMEKLAPIISPQTVIFTNIGEAHSEGFISEEEKTSEKTLLAKEETVNLIIYPDDDILLKNALTPTLKGKRHISWSYTNPSAELYLQTSNSETPGFKHIVYNFYDKTGCIEVAVDKNWELDNIASALAFLLNEGLTEDTIRQKFSKLYKITTRLNVTEGLNGCSVIHDTCTSDLSSLKPALDFMMRRKMPLQSPVLVLSDIEHPGPIEETTYGEIASIVKRSGIKHFIGVGSNLNKYASLFPEGSMFFKDPKHLLSTLSASDFIDEIILLKGSPKYDLTELRKNLEARNHETVLEVNLDALISNYNYFRSKIPRSTGIIAMIKASGYGAGSYELAKTLQDSGAAMVAVATSDEGVELRRSGITMPILVLNPRSANLRSLFVNNLEPAVYSMQMLEQIITEARKVGTKDYPVHIKLDTGMHRMGFMEKEIPNLATLLTDTDLLKVKTVFSHLATADCIDMDDFTSLQLSRFSHNTSLLASLLGYMPKRHILNSAGILRFPEHHYDFVRLGIGLYGANTLPPEIEKPLATVMTLRSVIICIREIEQPETVGYSRKGKVTGTRQIATLPIGYADGISRKLGNGNMQVLINGKKAPTIGNICMDATMVDVTGIDCKAGDQVEIFGNNISVQTIAETLETIPYEIFTSISPRVKRIYFRE
ncbi:MAG: bifunctional UDP-N-acetylmuramoyl-tripeptide:D-alanyl-D-alanine ligase/alanine racemase [Muribaculaceae bacterium]|nr:bifunctional UDP-N-acetylmuramoyl-tripeptide:D-alanyl-D-alanine ligase/alanine racemase [Muribaculaceae bacterium]